MSSRAQLWTADMDRARVRSVAKYGRNPAYPSARPQGCQRDFSKIPRKSAADATLFPTCQARRLKRFRTRDPNATSKSTSTARSSPRCARRRDSPISARSTSATCPADRCIELKALKYYLLDFRNQGIFYESVTNQILDDLVAACEPRRMTVVGDFTPRGGIKTTVTASYEGTVGPWVRRSWAWVHHM